MSERIVGRPMPGRCVRLKRAVDLMVALSGLALFFPVLIIIGALIMMEDGAAPLFRQKRVGRGGREFVLLKFRTMTASSERDGVPRLCGEHDARLTVVGSFLRSHHLDELPQLWNVLRGDMSVVGHRPERLFFVRQIIERDPRYTRLYSMRPGLFSMATLRHGYCDSVDKMVERLRWDLEYLRQWSLWLDLKIILLTTVSILSGRKF